MKPTNTSNMKTPILIFLSVLFTACLPAHAAEPALKSLMLVPDQVVYQDDFTTPKPLDKTVWKSAQSTRWTIEDGVLRGRPSTPEFQATHKTHKGLEPRLALVKCPPSYIVQFSVRYVSGKPVPPLPARNIPSIDLGHHIGRVEFGVEGARLLAEGETVQLASAPDFKLELGRWYDVLAEAHDDEVVVQIAGGPTLHGKHPAYKGDNHTLAIIGLQAGEVELDNVTLWSVKPEAQPNWAATLAKLPPAELKTIRQKTPGQLAQEKAKTEDK